MLYDYIITNYQKDEPIFLAELPGKSRESVRQEMKKLTDEGKIERLYNGVYYLAYTTILGTKGKISIDKYIQKRYLEVNGGTITGTTNFTGETNFSAQMKLSNNKSLGSETADGTWLNLAHVDASGNTKYGYGSKTSWIGTTFYYGNNIDISANNYISLTNSKGQLYFTTDRFRPVGNDKFYLGDTSNKWKSLFAVTGTIQTSDRNKKAENIV